MRSDIRHRSRRGSSGFSLVEILVVVGIIFVMATAVATIQFRTAGELIDADAALAQVVGQMRFARQVSIDQRRTVEIQFNGTNNIQVIRQDDANNTTVMGDLTLPSGYSFQMPGGAPDTPEGFGNSVPVDLGGGTNGTFLSDGTFVDNSNSILNGTVFTMGSDVLTARAATLTGSTGRVKQYSWNNGAWLQQ